VRPQVVRWAPNYVLPGGFDTVAKSEPIAESLNFWRVDGTTVEPPSDTAFGSVRHYSNLVHDPLYVEGVFEGVRGESWVTGSQGGPGTVISSTAGMLSAAEDIVGGATRAGSLSSGMHHARWDRPGGFCTINGLAVVARMLAVLGYSVLIVDTDAHCGGGTWSLVGDIPDVGQVDISTSTYDAYDPFAGAGLSAELHLVKHRARYLSTIHRALASWEGRHGRPDVIIYNAGMDSHELCDEGGLDGITDDTMRSREALVFDWAGDVPVLWALAGGYTGPLLSSERLTALHRLTAEAAAH